MADTKTVRLLRPTFVEGMPKEANELIEIPEREVGYFVGHGIASEDLEKPKASKASESSKA